MPEQTIQELFTKYLDESITVEELSQLFEMVKNHYDPEGLDTLFISAFANSGYKAEGNEYDRKEIFAELLAKIEQPEVQTIKHGKVISIGRRRGWVRWAAAAIVLLLGAGYLYFNNANQHKALTESKNQLAAGDIKAPKTNRATITLSNGQKIFLDSAEKGTLALQGNVKVEKLADGQIRYNGNVQPKNEMVYNTLYNPKGSKVIDITLSDGTQVWLNAESSLKYPVAFAGSKREVEITGEAYFAVTKNPRMPFTASVNGMHVQVLGTHFNINAYPDEMDMKTTLLEGSVKVINANYNALLKPGQQAALSAAGIATKTVNTEEVIAWKEGFFHFESADLNTILRQFARWYDVEVVYEGVPSTDKYFSIVKRSSTLAQVLKALEAGGIKFTIEGKKLIVKSS